MLPLIPMQDIAEQYRIRFKALLHMFLFFVVMQIVIKV